MERQTCDCVSVCAADLWRSVEFRELLLQVEFGHLAAEDPQRTICMCIGMRVRMCVCMYVLRSG